MVLTTLITGWLVGSVPLAVLLGRMIHSAQRTAAQQPEVRVPYRYRAA